MPLKKTKPTPKCRMSGSFESGVLTRRSDPSIGLTNVPYAKMSKIIGPGVDDDVATVSLGFDFWFDGQKYSQIQVCVNGWVILGTNTFASFMTTFKYRPDLIKTSITDSGALLCPWFVDTRTVDESTTTWGPLGGVYYVKDHSSEGVRGIVRWVCFNYYNAYGTQIVFECVLYEGTGKIEFRYLPSFRNPSSPLVVEPIGSGGAQGIWTSGSNRWRDFTDDRTSGSYGGSTYLSTYSYKEGTNTTTPWSCDRRVIGVLSTSLAPAFTQFLNGNWPSGEVMGSMLTFSYFESARKNLPRVDLRRLDATSEFFDGKTSYFNDMKTLNYISGAIINYPTTLPFLYGKGTNNPENLISAQTSLFTPANSQGSVNKAASEYWLQKGIYEERETGRPWDESVVYEQSEAIKSTNFYTTGSSIEDMGQGFTQNIGAKQIIRLILPILSETLLRPSTSSIYYYDSDKKAILEWGNIARKDPGSPKAPNAMYDSIGFTPLGMYSSTIVDDGFDRDFIHGTSATEIPPAIADIETSAGPDVAVGFGANLSRNNKTTALMYDNPGSLMISKDYHVSNTGSIRLDKLLRGPFMVEKVIMRLPIAAGPGWTSDMTRTKRSIGFDDWTNTGSAEEPTGSLFPYDWPLDVGGPCVTAGLMTQHGSEKYLNSTDKASIIRELVVTGTFIPAGDDVSNIRVDLARKQDVTDYDDAAVQLKHFSITQEGFRAFSRQASSVVTSNVAGFFTGSVSITAEVVTSNGFLVQPRFLTRQVYDDREFSKSKTNVTTWHWSEIWQIPGATLDANALPSTTEWNTMAVLHNIKDSPRVSLAAYGQSEYVNLGQFAPGNANFGLSVYILAVNQCSRSQRGFNPTGRSTRDVLGLSSTNVKNPLYDFISQISTMISALDTSEGTAKLSEFDGAGWNNYSVAKSQWIPDIVMSIESSQKAPYVMMPKDDLIFFMSKCRPVKSASLQPLAVDAAEALPLTPGEVANSISQLYATLTGSHDIRVVTGAIEITLFGSYLTEGVEHDNPTFNEGPFSDSIHSVVGNESVIDQMDVDYSNMYSGTYTSRIITGSMFVQSMNIPGGVTTQFRILDRKVIADAINDSNPSDADLPRLSGHDLVTQLTPVREIKGSYRFTQGNDYRERYWDTLLPSLSEIWKADNVNVYSTSTEIQIKTPTDFQGIQCALFYVGPQVSPQPLTNNYTKQRIHFETTSSLNFTNMKWLQAFPFEPRYLSVNRSPNVASKFQTTMKVTNWGGQYGMAAEAEYEQTSFKTLYNMGVIAFNLQYSASGEWNPVYSGLNFTDVTFGAGFRDSDEGIGFFDKKEFIKAAFGYASPQYDGDSWRTIWRQGAALDSSLSSNFPNLKLLNVKTRISGTFTSDPFDPQTNVWRYSCGMMIEGWKYGIMNGYRQTSKAIFRRDSFGQFRDMLEQRLDGKFYYETVDGRVGTLDTTELSSTDSGMFVGTSMFQKSKETITQSPVQIIFVNSRGERTDPEKTDSANFSTEYTSSLPFYDGKIMSTPSIDTLELHGINPTLGSQIIFKGQQALNKTYVSVQPDKMGNIKIGSLPKIGK